MSQVLVDYSNYTIKDLNSKVIFIAGGPGCGKGTQCEKIVNYYGLKHLSVGDLLRAEQSTDLAQEIASYTSQGKLVSTEIVIELIKKAISGPQRNDYIIDGFPRELQQALIFEQNIGEIQTIIQFECPEQIIVERLLARMNATPVEQRRADDTPEVMKKRIRTFFEVSKLATDFYTRHGKVREVDALGSPDEVFSRVKLAMQPNVIGVVGATAMGKTELAQRLAIHAHYVYINAETFFSNNNATSCEQKVKILSSFLQSSNRKNFVLDGFPQTSKQAKIFSETFAEPLVILNIKADKDEVFNRIDEICGENTTLSQQYSSRFDAYLQVKDSLETFLKPRSCYLQLNGLQTRDQMFQLSRQKINPHVLVAVTQENSSAASEVISKLCSDQGYINIDYDTIIEEEKRRSIKEGSILGGEVDTASFLAYFRKVLYSDPSRNQKFILSGIPNSFELVRTLETEIVQFQKVLYFTSTEGGETQAQSHNFSSDWSDIVGYYHSKDMLVEVGRADTDIVNFNIENRNRYGLIVGPTKVGKTKIAKFLRKQKIAKIIKLQPYKEKLMKRLSTDENEVDEVATPLALTHLSQDLQTFPQDQITLLEEFPFQEGGFANIVEALGTPLFILRINADEELVVERFKQVNEVEELSDEEKEEISKSIALAEDINNQIQDMLQTAVSLTVYDIDVTVPELNTLQNVKEIFRKRIILTRNINPGFNEATLRNRLGFLAARYGYQFIAVEDAMQKIREEAAEGSEFANSDPHVVIDMIQRMSNSDKTMRRNVLLYNYLKADGDEGQPQEFYPNSKDEVFFVQERLGSIRCCLDFVAEQQNLEVEKVLDPKVAPDEPEKKPKTDEDEDADEDEDEDAKKKFNPDQFPWYQTEGSPMSLPQFFTQMRPTQSMMMQYSDDIFNNLESTFRNVHGTLEEGEDVYYYSQGIPGQPPLSEGEGQEGATGSNGEQRMGATGGFSNSNGKDSMMSTQDLSQYKALEPPMSDNQTLSVMASLGMQNSQNALVIFKEMDKDFTNRISSTELHTGLLPMIPNLTLDMVTEVMKILDMDNDGQLSFYEFIIFIKQVLQEDQSRLFTK